MFLLRPVFKFIKSKVKGIELSNELYFVEYNIGWQICSLFNLDKCYDMPHAQNPNEIYKICFKMITENKITLEEIVGKNNFNFIYKRIIEDQNKKIGLMNQSSYLRLHHEVLPKYLKTFYYKVHFNLLPLMTRFMNYCLDNNSRCLFCGWGPESESHIFGRCPKLADLWNILD